MALPVWGQVEIARPKAVGGALKSGSCSFSSSCGSGSGSGGGGVDSRLFLGTYFRGSWGGFGGAFSFCSVDRPRVNRSSALVVFFVSLSDGCAEPCLIASAFFLRSSASFASLLEPPSSLGVGRKGCEGTRSPCMSLGTSLQETLANHPPTGGEMSRGGLQSSRTSQSTCLCQRGPPRTISGSYGPGCKVTRKGSTNSPPDFLALSSCARSNLLFAFSFAGCVFAAGVLGCFAFFK
jgi:hypothetical protein